MVHFEKNEELHNLRIFGGSTGFSTFSSLIRNFYRRKALSFPKDNEEASTPVVHIII